MKISQKELEYSKKGEKYSNGYRLVYFYDDRYSIGEYSSTIEGFMIGFADFDPIIDENNIPKFISIDDILDRCLNDLKNIKSVGLYKTSGECIAIKDKTVLNKIK